MKRPELSLCSRCGRCLAVCPTYAVNKEELFSPRGRIFLLEAGFENHPALETCLTCGNCENTCPNQVPLPEWVFLKRLESSPLLEIPGLQRPLLSRIPREGTWFGNFFPDQFPKQASRSFSQNFNLTPKGDLILFLSCGPEYLYPEATRKLIRFLKDLGYSPGVIGPLCCGLPAASLGQKEAFLREARKTLKALSQTEAPILTLCASCLWVLKEIYPLVFSDTEEEEKAQAVAKRTEEALSYLGPRVSTWPLEGPLPALHIPCHLKAYQNRISFPGVQIEVCCGSARPRALFLENRLPQPFLEKLITLSPPLLATACTGCYFKLKKLLKAPPEVRPWVEFLSV